jgi:hypothetical protein
MHTGRRRARKSSATKRSALASRRVKPPNNQIGAGTRLQ